MPNCPVCQISSAVRPSSPRLGDLPQRLLGKLPYRCSGCEARFFSWRKPSGPLEETTELTPQELAALNAARVEARTFDFRTMHSVDVESIEVGPLEPVTFDFRNLGENVPELTDEDFVDELEVVPVPETFDFRQLDWKRPEPLPEELGLGLPTLSERLAMPIEKWKQLQTRRKMWRQWIWMRWNLRRTWRTYGLARWGQPMDARRSQWRKIVFNTPTWRIGSPLLVSLFGVAVDAVLGLGAGSEGLSVIFSAGCCVATLAATLLYFRFRPVSTVEAFREAVRLMPYLCASFYFWGILMGVFFFPMLYFGHSDWTTVRKYWLIYALAIPTNAIGLLGAALLHRRRLGLDGEHRV